MILKNPYDTIIKEITKEIKRKETVEEEKKLALKKKLNMRLYPIYKMVGADVLFFNAVKVLFLTQVKGISNANVVFMETIYAFFKLVLQVPMTVVVSKLGIRKSIIIGNIFWILEFVLIMLSNNYFVIILSQFLSAIAWSCKTISETPMLNTSVPEARAKGKIFSKLESKGYSRYCYISAITTVCAGFLYEVNPYIPIILGITIIVFALIISINFIQIDKEEKKEHKTVKQSVSEVKEGFIFILNSPRLKSLLLMIGFMWGMICLFGTYQNTLLKDIHVPAKYIGIILAALDIIQGMSATKANQFNEKHKNHSLTYIGIRMTVGIAIAGGVVIIGLSRIPQLAIIIFTCILRMSDKGVFQIIRKRYMGNFMTPVMLTKIYAVYSLIASLFRMTISAIGSYLLTFMTIEYAMVVVGILFTMVILLLSQYMKERIGLKPEEYTKKDIAYMQ